MSVSSAGLTSAETDEASALEMAGWAYRQHLARRVYALTVHGEVAGTEEWMGVIDDGAQVRVDNYIGYFEPYSTSHDALDEDEPTQKEARNVRRAVAKAAAELRASRLQAVQPKLARPRPEQISWLKYRARWRPAEN